MTKTESKVVENKNRELNAFVSYFLIKSGYSKDELASLLGMCPASIYNKLKNPNSFTFGEIRELARITKMSEQQILAIV